MRRKLSREDIVRWKRINQNPAARALFDRLMRLAGRIPDERIVADIFEHVAFVCRAQIGEQRRGGAHDPDGDWLLLFYYDRARNNELPGQTIPWSKATLAKRLNRAAPERWGTVSAIERRLTRLVNERNKQLKAERLTK